MAPHSLYPGFIRLFYTGNAHGHQMVLPVKPSASGATWKVEKVLGGSYDPWTQGVDALVLVLKPLLKTTDGIASADLFTMTDETADPLFRESYTIGVAGTGGGTISPNVQGVFTWRTSLGGTLRCYVMEPAGTLPDIRDVAPISAGAYKTFSDLFTSSAGFVFGRDGGSPIAPIAFTTKTNDQLRKKHLLDV